MLMSSFSKLSNEAGFELYETIAVIVIFNFNLIALLLIKFDSIYGDEGTITTAGVMTDSGTELYTEAATDESEVLRASRTSV